GTGADIQLQPVALARVQRGVAFQLGKTNAGQQKLAMPAAVAATIIFVTLVFPAQANGALPVMADFFAPLSTQCQTLATGIDQLLTLITGDKAQLVRQG